MPTSTKHLRPRRTHTAARTCTAALLVSVALLSGCSGSSDSASPTTTEPAEITTTVAPTTSVDPATLPQTEEKPTTTGAAFQKRMNDLAMAIIADDHTLALASFFPVEAYKQVKKNTDPAGDWKNRLIAAFKVDTHEANTKLGTSAATATYLGVDVPDAAVWVKPGQEYNLIGYWRVYGSKLQFDVGGTTKTIPVNSLISWRGQWYVVHLGTIR